MRRIKNSLSAKAFLWVFCALLLCSSVIYTVIMVALPLRYASLVNIQTSANIETLTSSLDGVDVERAKELIYNFCIENRTYAMIQTDEGPLSFGDKGSFADSGDSYTISGSVKLSGQDNISVLTIVAPSSVEEVNNTLLTLVPGILGIIVCISGACAWLCGKNIVRPVLDICGVSRRMAQLDMTWRCDDTRTDELGVLAGSLNTLSARLTKALTELEAANSQLKLDIEASQTMEKQRRDFFSAASHELKTPVTVLRGLLESMELGIGDYKNHEKYLPRAISAVEDIEALINEILTISKMETGILPDAYTEEKLSCIVDDCLSGLRIIADEKELKIDTVPSEDITLRVYKPLFKKAIANILSNAVRYSPNGEKIRISWTRGALTVFNGGVEIPEEDISMLFTPFYRAEKSRNRKSGGSGLGLYIVKMILDLHGFGCSIENTAGGVQFTAVFGSER